MSVAFNQWLDEIGISEKQKIDPTTMKVLEGIWNEIQELKENE